MKRFYLLRIVCLVVGFALPLTSAAASWPVSSRLLAAVVLAFGLVCELCIRYKTGEEQKVRVTSRKLLLSGMIYFVALTAGEWLFERVNVFNNPYATTRLLHTTLIYLYLTYLFKIYFESRKNQTQEKQ